MKLKLELKIHVNFKGCKVVMKDTLKYIPILGWSWSCTEYIFLKRVWETDKTILNRELQSILDYPKDLNFLVNRSRRSLKIN
jgi:1-acyl-sn-glycerol-3-phosphate acyltransferase